jgi:hypothetical protein
MLGVLLLARFASLGVIELSIENFTLKINLTLSI